MNTTEPTWDTQDIANFLGVGRRYVTDELTKEPWWPKPIINMSQRIRRWRVADVKAAKRPKQ